MDTGFIIPNNLQISGSEDDDSGGDHLRSVLAALPALLHLDRLLPVHHQVRIHPGNVPGHLLAGNEQLDVQSDHLLLDECEVRSMTYIHVSGPHFLLREKRINSFYLRQIIKQTLSHYGRIMGRCCTCCLDFF